MRWDLLVRPGHRLKFCLRQEQDSCRESSLGLAVQMEIWRCLLARDRNDTAQSDNWRNYCHRRWNIGVSNQTNDLKLGASLPSPHDELGRRERLLKSSPQSYGKTWGSKQTVHFKSRRLDSYGKGRWNDLSGSRQEWLWLSAPQKNHQQLLPEISWLLQ